MNTSDERKENDYNDIYKAYNNYIISKDIYIFAKMIARVDIFLKTIDIPGDILECGVFKGTGLFLWIKLLNTYCPNSNKKVIGFDLFDCNNLIKIQKNDSQNVKMFEKFLNFAGENSNEFENINNVLKTNQRFNKSKIIKGDISNTLQQYLNDNPGMRISLLHLDLDTEKPTYDALCMCWDKITPGGIILFDEYAVDCCSESNGVDKFIIEKKIEIKSINIANLPTAYIVKKYI